MVNQKGNFRMRLELYKEIFKRYQGRMNSTKITKRIPLLYKQSQQRVSLQAPDQFAGSRSCGNSTRSFSGWKGAPTGRCELAIKKSSNKNLQNSCFCTNTPQCPRALLTCFVDMITSELDLTCFSSHI